jgi:hypothetical protein
MNERWIEHPAIPFVTSIGSIGLQVLSWPLLFVVGVAVHRNPPVVLQLAEVAWCALPLLSLLGIVSASMRLRRKRNVLVSSIGLALNAGYFVLFVLAIFLVCVMGVTA